MELRELKEKLKGLNIEQLDGVLYKFDTQRPNDIMTVNRTEIVKAILLLRTDLKEQVKTAHFNRGSQVEILVSQQLYKEEMHQVNNDQKSDITQGRWDYEIKSFTNNSACHGYSTIEKWNDVIDSKIMVLAFENVVYQPTKAQMKKIFPLLKIKTDKNKKGKIELRIAGNKKNHKIVQEFANLKGYLDLTV